VSEPQLLEFEIKGDERGSLVALEAQRSVPFEIKRVYYIFGTQPDVVRGCHAHRDLQQVCICVSGSCKFMLDDGLSRHEVLLDRPDRGLLIGSMIWREMSEFSADCVLMVLANSPYDEADYIRDFSVFLSAVAHGKTA
jgi:dTDP-4-dehydrorhamnose 3,5-epimerase-like enzyme